MEKISLGYEALNDTEAQRIFQKIYLGDVILKSDFFKKDNIEGTYIYFLKVKQVEDTRLTIIEDDLYKFVPDDPLYNYVDNKRAYILKNSTMLIFNDLDIKEEELKIVNEWNFDVNDLSNLKKVWEFYEDRYTFMRVYLLFKEDVERIKAEVLRRIEEERLEKIRREEKRKAELEKQNKLEQLRKNFKTLSAIEDDNVIIKDNYFIDKKDNLKVVFNKNVVEIFDVDDILRCYNFLDIDYRELLRKIARIYYIGTYEPPLERKLNELGKKRYWLIFKVYDLRENKEEFLSEIKIENKIVKGKYRFFINGVRIPARKMVFAINYLAGIDNSYAEIGVVKERLRNINKNLNSIKKFSGTQLEILKGINIDVCYNDLKIPLFFNVDVDNKDRWKISFNGFNLNTNYNTIKEVWKCERYGAYKIVGTISHLNEILGKEIEDVIIDYVRKYIEKRKQAEQKAKQLFLDFVAKNSSRIIPKDDYYIVKGKLKNYKLFFKNNNDVGVESYPNGNYICITEKDKAGDMLVGYDKMLQYALSLLNDSDMREEINTLDR